MHAHIIIAQELKGLYWENYSHCDCFIAPNTGNKSPIRQTSEFWSPQLSLNHCLFQEESKDNVPCSSFVKEKHQCSQLQMMVFNAITNESLDIPD